MNGTSVTETIRVVEARKRITTTSPAPARATRAGVEVRRIPSAPPILLAALRRDAIEREFVEILAKVIDDNARLAEQVRTLAVEMKFQAGRLSLLEAKHECA